MKFLITKIICIKQQFQPIFRFGALFQCNIYLGKKIPSADGALCLSKICTYTCSTAQKLLGKHKLCLAISPKKTVEGAVAGLIGGVAFGALLIPLQKLWDGVVDAPYLLVIGLICGVCAQFGDLFASLLKRWAGVKDFSSIFPEHGGIMDRIDSILLCAPVVLCLFTILRLLGIY